MNLHVGGLVDLLTIVKGWLPAGSQSKGDMRTDHAHRILLIEDDLELADNVLSILQLAKYEVGHAPNGRLGVEMVTKFHPDLILCDVIMPELDGYGVAHILNSNIETANIPFIFLTAKAEQADFRKGMNLGADDYIVKPFDDLDLLKVIEVRLRKRAALKTNNCQVHQDFHLTNKMQSRADSLLKLFVNYSSRCYKRKEILFREGQIPGELFFINAGKIKTFKVNYEGKELITGIHGTGQYLGYLPLLESTSYSEVAEVLEDSRVTVIPKNEFLTVVNSSTDMLHFFLRILSIELKEMEERLLDIAYHSVRQRVANALLKFTHPDLENETVVVNMTRRDLAEVVGTATESLNRTLSDFKEERLVEIIDGTIKITDRLRLKKLLR